MPASPTGAVAGMAGLEAEVERLFARDGVAVAIVWRVLAACSPVEGLTVRPSATQLALARRRTFALLWPVPPAVRRPGSPPVVLSIALAREIADRRIKQVSRPTGAHWLHHIELWSAEAVDEAVRGWLREAAGRAG